MYADEVAVIIAGLASGVVANYTLKSISSVFHFFRSVLVSSSNA